MPHHKPSQEEAMLAIKTLLAYLGEDPSREELIDTPRRVLKTYQELFAGYQESLDQVLGQGFDPVPEYQGMVCLNQIPFYSHCEHHIMPLWGYVDLAYLPYQKLAGLSKLARVVEHCARKLQSQERLCAEIIKALETYLSPKGVAVSIRAEHTCMSARGVLKQGATTLTQDFTGEFQTNEKLTKQFFDTLKRSS